MKREGESEMSTGCSVVLAQVIFQTSDFVSLSSHPSDALFFVTVAQAAHIQHCFCFWEPRPFFLVIFISVNLNRSLRLAGGETSPWQFLGFVLSLVFLCFFFLVPRAAGANTLLVLFWFI